MSKQSFCFCCYTPWSPVASPYLMLKKHKMVSFGETIEKFAFFIVFHSLTCVWSTSKILVPGPVRPPHRVIDPASFNNGQVLFYTTDLEQVYYCFYFGIRVLASISPWVTRWGAKRFFRGPGQTVNNFWIFFSQINVEFQSPFFIIRDRFTFSPFFPIKWGIENFG